MSETGTLQNYSVDQVAGAVVLVLGAIAGLLQVIWMSKCHCRVNCCYFFQCERRPPTEEEMKTLAQGIKDKKDAKKEANTKALKETKSAEDETLVPPKSPKITADINDVM